MSNSLIRLLKMAKAISDSGDIETFNSFCAQFDAFVKKCQINKVAHMEPKNDGTTPNPWRKNLDYSPWENSPYYGSVSEFMEKFPGGIRDWLDWRKKTEKERFQLWDPEKTKERKAYLESLMKTAEESEPFWAIHTGINWNWFALLQPEGEGFRILKYDRIHIGDPSPKTGTTVELIEGEGRVVKAVKLRGDRTTKDTMPVVNPKYVFSYPEITFNDEENFKKKAHFEPVGPDNTKDFPKEPHLYSGDKNVGDWESIEKYIEEKRKATGQSADDAARGAVEDFINYYKEMRKSNKSKKNRSKKGKR